MTRTEAQQLRRKKESRKVMASEGPDVKIKTVCRRLYGCSVQKFIRGMLQDGYSEVTVAGVLNISLYRLKTWIRDYNLRRTI